MTVTVSEAFAVGVTGEIRAWMGRRSLNQARLAELLGENEIWVSRRLRGKVSISVDELARFAMALECSIGALLPPLEDIVASVTNDMLDAMEPVTPKYRPMLVAA